MKKLLAIAAGACLTVVALTGCSFSGSGTEEDPLVKSANFSAGNSWVKMDDGRTVYCFFYDRGVSCDWENAR